MNKKFDEEIDNLNANMSIFEHRVEQLESKISFDSKADFISAVNEQVNKHIKEFKEDFHHSQKCSKKIVIFGLPESDNDEDDDITRISELASALNISDFNVTKTFHIKSNSTHPHPLNIQFRYEYQKQLFLNKDIREKLNTFTQEQEFHGLSILPDRTFKERAEYRRLKVIMLERNSQLEDKGICDKKWIIRSLNLQKVKVTPPDSLPEQRDQLTRPW